MLTVAYALTDFNGEVVVVDGKIGVTAVRAGYGSRRILRRVVFGRGVT
jgi:hypothetical protein